MQNPENKPLRIKRTHTDDCNHVTEDAKVIALSNLAIAEAILVNAGKDSGLPHFLAIVKQLEQILGFQFEYEDDKNQN